MDELHRRWPHLTTRRTLPYLPYKASTQKATEALRLRRYLDEVDRQAAIFVESFGEAMKAALVRNDGDACWRHLQSSLFAAIVVSRLLIPENNQRAWPGVSQSEAKAIAQDRAQRLREALRFPVDDPSFPLFQVVAVRNSMEHIDERLDWLLHSGAEASSSDWYLSNGELMAFHPGQKQGNSTPHGLRAFIPSLGLLFFGTQRLNMFLLDIHMLSLRNNASIAAEELAESMPPGVRYTHGQLAPGPVPESMAPDKFDGLRDWEEQRRAEMAKWEPPPSSPGKLWWGAS